MSTIVTRAGKGSQLTHAEVDANFTNLNTDKLDTAGIALGSAASPTIKFTGDVNTGIYSPGADQLALSTGGAERMRIDSAGNVNVTTAALAQYFGINATGTAASVANGLFAPTSNTLGFVTNATERARIDSSGRLLVGTSTARSVATISSGLQIESSNYQLAAQSITNIDANALGPYLMFGKARSTGAGVVSSGDELGSIFFAGADGADLNSIGAKISANVDGTPGADDMPGRLVFLTTPDGLVAPTERMRIDSTGRVGIGTSSPQHSVHVSSTANFGAVLKVSDTVSNSTGGIAFGDGGSSQVATGFWRGAANSYSTAGNTLNVQGESIQFMSGAGVFGAASERARIDSSGRLLVGTSTANTSGAKLQTSDGLTFPATQVASADPNTLDDYEEGTFTPTVIGTTLAGTGTYTVQSGKYIKIGGKVYVEIAMTWTAHTGTGAMQFAGLPFTAASAGNAPGVSFGRVSNIALTASNLLLGFVAANTTTIPLRQYAVGGGAEASVTIDTAGEVNFSATYMVV